MAFVASLQPMSISLTFKKEGDKFRTFVQVLDTAEVNL